MQTDSGKPPSPCDAEGAARTKEAPVLFLLATRARSQQRGSPPNVRDIVKKLSPRAPKMSRAGGVQAWVAVIACGVLTLGAIAGGGALASTAIGPYLKARGWVLVDANIISVSLELRPSKGRTEKLTCRVEYDYVTLTGDKYHGNRASLYAGGARAFDAALCRRLAVLHETGNGHCFYDPAQPGDSVLSRRLRHDVLCSAILILFLLGGAALSATVACIERMCRRARRARLTILADQQRWPLLPIAIAVYASILVGLAGTFGVVCVMERDWDAFWTLTLAAICFALLCYCVFWAYRSSNFGLLKLSENADGSAVLRIPWHADGKAVLTLQWVRWNSLLDGATKGKAWDLRVMDMADREDGWVEIALLTLPRLPDEMLDHSLLQLRVKGRVGEREYKAKFDFGTVGEFHRVVGTEV